MCGIGSRNVECNWIYQIKSSEINLRKSDPETFYFLALAFPQTYSNPGVGCTKCGIQSCLVSPLPVVLHMGRISWLIDAVSRRNESPSKAPLLEYLRRRLYGDFLGLALTKAAQYEWRSRYCRNARPQVLKTGALTIPVGSFTKRCSLSGESYKQWFATFGGQQSQGIPTGQHGFHHKSLANFSIRFH